MSMETKEGMAGWTWKNKKAEFLHGLGFKAAAAGLEKKALRAKKLMLAYEHYRFVRQEHIAAFNAKLMKAGKNMDNINLMEYQRLEFVPTEYYQNVPPADVLEALGVAQKRECFDSFEVAYIKNIKDPLLFGRIDQCADRFFIAEWDSDVSIKDLLKENEG